MSKSSASTTAESGRPAAESDCPGATVAPIVYTRRPIFVHRIGFVQRFWSSALGRDEADHAGGSRLRANGKSAVMKGCRYPLRIQAELAVHAHPELPAVAVAFMQQIMN